MPDRATPWPAPASGPTAMSANGTPARGSAAVGAATGRPRRSGLTAPRSRRRALISLTPLIDVVFILLVFYMLASTFTDWNAIPLALDPAPRDGDPAGSAAASRPQQPYAGALMLDVQPEGLRLSGRPLADAELPARLAALRQEAAAGGAAPGASTESIGQKVILRPMEGVPWPGLGGPACGAEGSA